LVKAKRFIDEFGNTHLDLSKKGTFSHFIYTSIIIEESENANIFSELIKSLNLNWEDSGISIIIFLLTSLSTAFIIFWKLTVLFKQKRNELKLNKNLHPYFSKKEVRTATQLYIDTRCQNIPPSNHNEPSETYALITNQKLIPFFIKKAFSLKKKDDKRFYLILADSGMGKTTFMINLYLSYIKKNWLKKQNKIKLLPLGHFNSIKEIEQMSNEEKQKTILLLDAFDEDNIAAENYKKRLSEILKIVWRFKEVVITCRTQFFPSEIEEPQKTGLLKLGGDKGEHLFNKLYLTPFSNSDVKKYIRKKINFLYFKRRIKAYKVVKMCPNLMVRPMLLNYIEEIIEPEIKIKNITIEFNLKVTKISYSFSFKTLSSSNVKFNKLYQIYKALIQKWIEREGNRKTEKREEFMQELYLFSREIALNMYEMRNNRGGYFIHKNDIIEFATRYNVNLEELEMRSRSLLNRNAEGFYKFSHKSIMEYFLAREAIENKNFRSELDKTGLDVLVQFLEEQLELDWLYKNRLKGRGSFDTSDFDSTLKQYKTKDLTLLTKKHIEELTFLRIENKYIPSVNFLSHSNKIKKLLLRENQLRNCQSIEKLKDLEYLDLSQNKLIECNMVEKLTKLKTLILSYNLIESGEPITNLINLELLFIHNNKLKSCEFLKNLINLRSLALIYNEITDFSSILNLSKLEVLFLPNAIKDSQLKEIRKKLQNCKITLVRSTTPNNVLY
jgi:hypothetical protein